MTVGQHLEKLTVNSNFEIWKFKIRNYIAGKRLLTILDKTYSTPTEPKAKEELAVDESRTVSILSNALDEHHLASVIHCKTANEMWQILKVMREGTSDKQSKFQLRCQMNNYKFKKGQTLGEYLRGLNLLVAKLKRFSVNIEDSELIAKVITDLPKPYQLFVETFQIITMQLSSQVMFKEFEKLLREADSMISNNKIVGDASDSTYLNDVTCFNCGKKGHLKKDCRGKRKQGKTFKKEITCFNCGKKGHLKKNCWSFKR
jgi:acyl carrier protein phosphodiesterase